jgi:hypothetical protein
MHSLLWARPTVLVPPFSEQAEVEVPLPCTCDLQVAAANYLHALGDGAVPLELLFSGTIFYGAAGRLQAALIPASAEAAHELPVAVWREAIERHFPGCAWLRLEREAFDSLAAYKARHALASWEQALARLMAAEQENT